jgi:predicted PurR-regulated permease PerM
MRQDVSQHEQAKASTSPLTVWTQRLVISLTLLVWIILAGILFWLIGRTAQAFLLLAIGALLAYTMYPLVRLLQRIMPHPFAIAIVYITILGALSALVYFVIVTFMDQVISLIQYIQGLINGRNTYQLQPILDTLKQFGISQSLLRDFGQQILGQLQGIVSNVVPAITNVFNVFLNTILAAILSVYFLLSGPRATTWLRTQTPSGPRKHIVFVLDTLATVIGGYIRGNILLAVIISTLTGISIALIGVPYPFLLAVLTFILEFIPVIGIYITSAAVLLLAFTQGWVTGLLALGMVLLLQLLENNVFAPRILGRSVGVNPIINIFALIAGTNLFGIAGVFFAAPVAGMTQAFIRALWANWSKQHPERFQETKPPESEGEVQT